MSTLVLSLYGTQIHAAVGISAGVGVIISVVGTVGFIIAGLPYQALMPPFSVGYVSLLGVALMAPAKTPRPIIDKLSKATLKVIAEPEMQKRLAALGVQPSTFTPEQFGEYLQAEAKKIGDLIKSANIKATK